MKRERLVTKHGQSEFDEPQVSIAPLIDVSFLLLIFFIVTTTIMRRERDLGMRVPGPPDSEFTHPPLPVVVEVRKDGEIALNPGVGETLVSRDPNDRDLPVLLDHLQAMQAVQGEREIAVQLRADDEANQQRVVDVLNCFASIGVTSVGLVD